MNIKTFLNINEKDSDVEEEGQPSHKPEVWPAFVWLYLDFPDESVCRFHVFSLWVVLSAKWVLHSESLSLKTNSYNVLHELLSNKLNQFIWISFPSDNISDNLFDTELFDCNSNTIFSHPLETLFIWYLKSKRIDGKELLKTFRRVVKPIVIESHWKSLFDVK